MAPQTIPAVSGSAQRPRSSRGVRLRGTGRLDDPQGGPEGTAEGVEPCVAGAAFGHLQGRIEILQVACCKCERAGRYRLAGLIERYGADAGLPDWKDLITADCPLRAQPGTIWNGCGAFFPGLS